MIHLQCRVLERGELPRGISITECAGKADRIVIVVEQLEVIHQPCILVDAKPESVANSIGSDTTDKNKFRAVALG